MAYRIPWGVFATMAPAYASEVCPTVLRGYLTVYVNLTWAFGQLVGAGVQSALSSSTTEWAYRIPFAIQWVWPLPIALLAYCAPESPWYLIRTGNSEGALSSIKRLSPTKTECEHRAQLAMMQHTNQLEMDISAGTSYWDCFKGIDRRRTEIVCMVCAKSTARLSGLSPLTLTRSLLLNLSVVVPWVGLLRTSLFRLVSLRLFRSR